MNLSEGLKTATNRVLTQNGANALASTNSAVLDFFVTVGTLRTKAGVNTERALNDFLQAFGEDRLLATRALFYGRDVRGGIGEREIFRTIYKYLADNYPLYVLKTLHLVAEFGRWDDVHCLLGTKCESAMIKMLAAQLSADYLCVSQKGYEGSISLVAKWGVSPRSRKQHKRIIAAKVRTGLGVQPREFVKMVVACRKYLDLVERKMSKQLWDKISYRTVPAKAMKLYRKAFTKHDPARLAKFLEKVENGTEKINAGGGLTPTDLLKSLAAPGTFNLRLKKLDPVIEAQWKSLPDYVEGGHNVLIMADTSGSMQSDESTPLATAVGLAMYFADRNKGQFAKQFMTFSSRPSLVTLKGNTLPEKLACIPEIIDNTDLSAAFNLILQVAVANKIPQNEMPKTIVVISDMQFDAGACRMGNTLHSEISARYAANGYTIPNVVYWVVNMQDKTFPVAANAKYVQMFSGSSVATFKNVMRCIGTTPYMAMLKVLNNERYSQIMVD